jgi:hypothetical protein
MVSAGPVERHLARLFGAERRGEQQFFAAADGRDRAERADLVDQSGRGKNPDFPF